MSAVFLHEQNMAFNVVSFTGFAKKKKKKNHISDFPLFLLSFRSYPCFFRSPSLFSSLSDSSAASLNRQVFV